ncbi:MAG: peptidoglycan-binding protein [Candidatus Binatia bacterium]|nr:peptidoglycan-binding protein [Candidatus Binatia bacterium]
MVSKNGVMQLWLVAGALSFFMLACQQDTEARAREAAEKIKESIPDVQARALSQPVTEEEVREAQLALREVKEYLGEVNGKLDAVTVNAIQAFQRSRGIRDDGILNERTKRELRKVLSEAQSGEGAAAHQ